ncbi:hypothetical protein MYP_2464 [Sporocytophaga myxococcoides]|uniref:Uncharacterized protein n=1 Tax=Sporocytophaga myxococcoides TaxID=153721 RepID=A0A098LE99_9BACT|nr:hypothetical protein [Sporocytophaga myxococcoides]GAL85235.1 hypothetical protein MYP_2464 [Sporocytophaga myxococcoides]
MALRTIIILALTFVSLNISAQSRPKEGLAPKANIYLVEGDSENLITYLKKNKENKIKVKLEGGIENVKHTMYVTSKHASIKPDLEVENQYIIVPKEENVEIIVDIKTEEDYNQIQMVDKNGKQKKEIVKKLTPKTYMVGYEKVKVN